MTKEEWHEYFIKNKDRFTSSQIEACKYTNKIWIPNRQQTAKSTDYSQNWQEDIEEGNWGTLYRSELF